MLPSTPVPTLTNPRAGGTHGRLPEPAWGFFQPLFSFPLFQRIFAGKRQGNGMGIGIEWRGMAGPGFGEGVSSSHVPRPRGLF